MSLDQFFKQEPEHYKQYCRLVLEDEERFARGAEHTPSALP